MIINNAPQAEAIVSNVGEIGEFRIRNSAKAFNILSSGLYANKIRAIIRELSCNAIDSHVAAGNNNPFEVHLPTSLEPYFYVKDFGTGLNHEQVTNIYTTYFESTKTNSNDFIGALGLGSKSPFSYTDNFTVTAIKDGRKGIYTAFINEAGVPSIALMAEQETDEHNGVEVRFAVTERYDFSKFVQEATEVFRWFKQQPKIVGNDITIEKQVYETENIILGVHSRDAQRSLALMGNIVYPISVPNANENLGELQHLLGCGLVMEFNIGELDFQASREGLSYIPQTIESIRKKLDEVNSALSSVLAKEADAISNMWERSVFLHKKRRESLWKASVTKYVNDTNFTLFDKTSNFSHNFTLNVKREDLAKLNIQIRGFTNRRGEKACHTHKSKTYNFGKKTADGSIVFEEVVEIDINNSTFFVVNDLKIGATERAKYHFRRNAIDTKSIYNRDVHVLEKIDKKQEMDLAGFFNLIHNPPENVCFLASDLDEKPRAQSSGGIGKNVTILQLEQRGGSRWHRSSNDLVWRAAGSLNDLDDSNKTFYYVPLSGFVPKFDILDSYVSVHEVVGLMADTKLPQFNVSVYGVRKGDLDAIKNKKNWVNLEGFLAKEIDNLKSKVEMGLVMEGVDKSNVFDYNMENIVNSITNDKSPAKKLLMNFSGLPKLSGIYSLKKMMHIFKINSNISVGNLITKYNAEISEFNNRYPLIDKLSSRAKEGDVSDYINLIDFKGV